MGSEQISLAATSSNNSNRKQVAIAYDLQLLLSVLVLDRWHGGRSFSYLALGPDELWGGALGRLCLYTELSGVWGQSRAL